MSKGDEVPAAHHVIRYCPYTRLREEDGSVLATAFLPSASESYLSVFWLEYDGTLRPDQQISDVRKRMTASRITLRTQGKLAKLNVGSVKGSILREFARQLAILHEPVDGNGERIDDAHVGIHGINSEDLDIADFIAENMIEETYGARA